MVRDENGGQAGARVIAFRARRARPAADVATTGAVVHDLAERRLTGRRLAPRRGSTASTFRVRITLEHSDPPIWRRLELAPDLSLPHLFEATRTAMGWTGFLLHFFRVPSASGGDVTYSPAYGTWDREGYDENDVRLDDVVTRPGDAIRLVVVDDYGDEWWHELVLEAVERADARGGASTRRARCVDGDRACPPGDSEGIDDYNAAVAQWREDVVASRASVWWSATHDPEAFDAALVDDLLDHVVPQALPTVPTRADVADCVHDLWWRCTDDGRAALDRLVADLDTTPGEAPDDVADLVRAWTGLVAAVGEGVPVGPDGPEVSGVDVEVVRLGVRFGLVRVLRGRLVPTVAGRRGRTRPDDLRRHVARRMLTTRADLRSDAGLVAALQLATGREHSVSLTTRILTSAGHTELDEPLPPSTAHAALDGLRSALRHTGGCALVAGVPVTTPAGHELCRLAVSRPG